MMASERNEDKRRWALGNGAIGFLYTPVYASAVDRKLHRLFRLRDIRRSAVATLILINEECDEMMRIGPVRADEKEGASW
jgi:hypothetical protein